jgi:hypothetical protein
MAFQRIGNATPEEVSNDAIISILLITSAIAKYLHPTATIYNKGFERTSLPNGYFDLVPFGGYSVFEPRYDGLIHLLMSSSAKP